MTVECSAVEDHLTKSGIILNWTVQTGCFRNVPVILAEKIERVLIVPRDNFSLFFFIYNGKPLLIGGIKEKSSLSHS